MQMKTATLVSKTYYVDDFAARRNGVAGHDEGRVSSAWRNVQQRKMRAPVASLAQKRRVT
ncbi:MAG: hypothetical protein ACLPV8_02850 [Steroidobacteraceae bacterium]